jgi:hypothetical protein
MRKRKPTTLPIDPGFLRGRLSPAEIESAKKSKPSRESVEKLTRAHDEAAQKVGWAKGKLDESLTDAAARKHYQARAASGTAMTADIVPYWDKHVVSAHASTIASGPRPARRDWLSELIGGFLADTPGLSENEASHKLRVTVKQRPIDGCSNIHVDKHGVSWTDKAGKRQRASLKDRLSRARSRRGK